MATNDPDDDDQRACRHFNSVIDGAILGEQLPNGLWQYTTPLLCQTCGRRWTEIHDQAVRRHPVEEE
jgi:hypothetical protein